MASGETAHRRVGGRYTLVEPLGHGGMGTVWRGCDELLQRDVAVKHVSAPALDRADGPVLRQRVIREAQAAARLGHPATVTVFDVVEDAGGVHIVMELVETDTLAELVDRDGPLPVERVARLGLDLAGALDAAHRQGIVHRDVKPSNVMMLPSGAAKLADFGIASVRDEPTLTGTGQVLGSPNYMAPEQAHGGPSGEEVDWWGLGATLYFAVEGRPPFERDGALATLAAVVTEDPRPAERAGPLAPLLAGLLDKDPASRPAGAALRRALRDHADGDGRAPGRTAGPSTGPETVPARPARPVEPPPAAAEPPASRRGAAVAALLVVLALVAGVLVWTSTSGGGGSDGAPTRGDPAATAAGDVPEDWVAYTDPRAGYRVSHPPGWRVRRLDGTRTDITDPDTGSYLRIDWTETPGPSPEGAWRSLSERFGARHDAYREIRIEPTTYKGFDAAVWEYAYTDGGARLHAVNLGFVAGTRGFALNFQTHEDRWEESQDRFDAFRASFRPPG